MLDKRWNELLKIADPTPEQKAELNGIGNLIYEKEGGRLIECLSDGFVRLVDVMGSDQAVVQAARVSYGAGTRKVSEDRDLIRYLMRNAHTSPFEMVEFKFHIRVPMDCFRQWIRHRTACLSGDTPVDFDLPGGIRRRGNQKYSLTLREIFRKFQPTSSQRKDKQRNPIFRRQRIQSMRLRCADETRGQPGHTHIVDVWESGVKIVYRVELENGKAIKMSSDHLCLTSKGWLKLKQAVDLGTMTPKVQFAVIAPKIGHNLAKPVKVSKNQTWKLCYGWPEYEVSDGGQVRRVIPAKGARLGRIKAVTLSRSTAKIGLSRGGKSSAINLGPLVLYTFNGPPKAGQECCHKNGNALDCRLSNLRWDTPESNSDDRVKHGATTKNTIRFLNVKSVQLIGPEMTYDMEVAGPFHNFSANGFIVHNSVNEYSTRYSEAIDSADHTSVWRLQATSNKQGSGGILEGWPEGWACDPDKRTITGPGTESKWSYRTLGEMPQTPKDYLTEREAEFLQSARRLYEERLSMGVAREQARKDLPLSTYTEAYWKIDCHNLFHFLRLRLDKHAQKEIRDYGEAMYKLIEPHVPLCVEAFQDYRVKSMQLSGPELEIISQIMIPSVERVPHRLGNREIAEFNAKMQRLGLRITAHKDYAELD